MTNYLTTAAAASTYLTQVNATSTYAGLAIANIFTNTNTFNTNVDVNGTMTFYSSFSFSTINQSSTTLNILNPNLGSSIILKTRPSAGVIQESLILNTTSCDIFSPTLNLASASTINILSPNNVTGTINLFNSLTTGNINFGSVTSTCNFDSETTFNSDVTIASNIYCDTAIYFKDIGTGSQSNQARIFKQDDYLFFDTNIDYTNGYTFRTSSIDIFTITQTETTANNQLTCNSSLYF